MKSCEYGIWIKLDKKCFNIDSNVYVCGLYLHPINSPYASKSPYEAIERDITDCYSDGDILLVGDTNSRTAELCDFIKPDKYDELLNVNCSSVQYEELPERFNSDCVYNSMGKQLIEFCTNSNTYIVNGRTKGDIPGKMTCIQHAGCSTVDYAIASFKLKECIKYFNVSAFNEFSDHALIKICIDITVLEESGTKSELDDLPCKYVWDRKSKEEFLNAFTLKCVNKQMNDVLSHTYNESCQDVDALCENVAGIYKKAASLSLRKKIVKSRFKHVKHSKESDKTYTKLREEISSLGSLLQKYPTDPHLRGKYMFLKKNFRRSLKRARAEQRENILEKIQQIENKNPTEFWKLVNNIKSKKIKNEVIDPDVFLDYFKSLHKPGNSKMFDNNFAKIISEKLKLKSHKIWINSLDKHITQKEITLAAKSLKNRKACGYDSISNEMIKYSAHIMMPILLKLFNKVLQTEYFPTNWSKGYIVPLYKSGDDLDPSNYRGITISNCIGKLFTKIMNTRLLEYLETNNIIKPNQIGFMPKHRTSDHILVLKTVIDSFKSAKKSLYMCFVDLKKAFDTVFHEGLFYKLKELNFSSKFQNLIKSMYNKVAARVKCLKGLTKEFPVSIGTRQGCNLSPLLFNIYVNDLQNSLNCKSTDIVKIRDTELKCLMYADDIILLNKTEAGMNIFLKQLEDYCNKWRLTISVKKTKIIIINCKRQPVRFKLYNTTLEIVDKYCYLGIMITKTGNLKAAIDRLNKKASNAYFGIRKEFNFQNNASPKVILKLFDTMIQPILLYGSEIWGVYGYRKCTMEYIRKYLLNIKHMFEDLHTKMCRNALGVHKTATEILVKAELGRYPLMCNIVKNIYSYWQHLLGSKESSLVRKVVLDNPAHNVMHYRTRVENIFESMNCEHLLQCHVRKKCDLKRNCHNVVTVYKNLYNDYFFNVLKDKANRPESGGRFEIYNKIKKVYRYEKYLILHKNILRRNITNIRISTHKLPIEALRKAGVDRCDRKCSLCSLGRIGTEFHAVMECENNDIIKLRKDLNFKMSNVYHQWEKMSPESKFVYLNLASDEACNFYYAIYLDKLFKMYKM